jgi:hypothetical protein
MDISTRNRGIALYVDRSTRQWIVRDSDGNFWTLAATDDPWDNRQPFVTAEETVLEPVPGHYKSMLGLPLN